MQILQFLPLTCFRCTRNAYARQQQRLAGELPLGEVIDASDSVIDFGDGAKGEPIADRAFCGTLTLPSKLSKFLNGQNRYFEDAKTYVL